MARMQWPEDLVGVSFGHGDGTVGSEMDYPQPLAQGMTAADMNGDGELDLVTGSGYMVNVRLNRGDGTFGAARKIYLPHQFSFVIGAADFNADGVADVAAQVYADGHYALAVMLNRNTSGRTTAVTLAQSSTHTQVREAVTFTARVWTGKRGVPTGSVRFLVDGQLWAVVPLRNGIAQFQTSRLPVTSWLPAKEYHTVVAVYDGNSSLAGSSSQRVTHAVNGPSLANFHPPVGWVDALNRRTIKGWTRDADTPARPVEVQVFVDRKYVGAAVASEWRASLGRHGFTFSMPALSAGKHGVEVFAVDTRTRQRRLILSRELG
jgi:hypothetical protein